MPYDFTVVLRGYDRPQVDRVLTDAEAAASTGDESVRAAAREALTNVSFTVVLRGYDRQQVDQQVSRLRQVLSATR
jgi:DivIVA domain-containing protein